ncbi:hypothetical protein AGABI1DRAFT_43790 [Agaricus bisporus var. burnettii JB137-S8]|uniref:Major facilitator superfamily (MFS) profile domain-containing protein n=1 Tax=Agaricus bisporus var. burnettii (strain JB137-S8 / ATCC MYA-4627 / FGSC 10392) TaxID=597362 RepID=K5VS29_AGABU|nr:uncharacterized protein AGABI1DRAFT_43790 [Agaricus bisporus var. burnettii JB137-S8]EKM77269.1 hypothetical protein AGABI1DRAFT_43790 [Agaricus bisporus var. burnettii JB137-S8]
MNEEVPLLVNDHDLIYSRFPPGRKKVLVIVVSWVGLLAFLTSDIFIPSIAQIAKDLNSTASVVGHSISINILGSAFGGLLASRYSKFYGRRPAFLFHLPLMVLGSLVTGRAESVPQLMVGRFIQGVGASPGLSVGAAVIGDIYKLEERGAALGTYFGTGLIGLALAPTIGGGIAHYSSWRAVHYWLAVMGCAILVCILLFLPETSHPDSRGIDEYKKSGKPLPKWRPVILNPIANLSMLRSLNITSTALAGCFALLTDVALMVPIAFTIGKRYNVDDQATIGLLMLPIGVGNAIGAPLAGWISDRTVIQYKAKRGHWYPEDRLRASLYGAYLSVTVIASALVTTYIPGTLGLVLNLVIFFFNGVGVSFI